MQVDVIGDAICVIPERTDRDIDVLHFLIERLLLPHAYAKKLVVQERVRFRNEALSPDARIQPGQKLWIVGDVEDEQGTDTNDAAGVLRENAPSVTILYEDAHALVADKPAGIIVHDEDAFADTLDRRVLAYYRSQKLSRRALHVHRLDRGTTGAVLYAQHGYSARALDKLLHDRAIHRTYVAMIRGALHPRRGTIVAPIGRDRHVSGRYRVSSNGKPAVTHYQTLDAVKVGNDDVSFVLCELDTGRTHQIRVHMASLGCPVVGDALYGAGKGIGHVKWHEESHALHAVSLRFPQLYGGSEVLVQAPIPRMFASALSSLKLTWDETAFRVR